MSSPRLKAIAGAATGIAVALLMSCGDSASPTPNTVIDSGTGGKGGTLEDARGDDSAPSSGGDSGAEAENAGGSAGVGGEAATPEAAAGAGGSEDASGDEAQSDADSALGDDATESGAPVTLRVMAANLSSGNLQSYSPGEGLRIFQGLKPDIVLLQEFNYGDNTDKELREFVDKGFGVQFSYYRESGAHIPNGVISRYPILQSGEWDDPNVNDRDFAWAKIDLPGANDLWAVSVHFLTASAGERNKNAQALMGYLTAQVPAGDLVVLGGDLNTETRTESCLTTLSNRFVTAGPWPVDQAANGNTNRNRSKPLDWVIASPQLQAFAVALEIVSQTFPQGLVFDSREYNPLSEVAPVQKTDSEASGMQHMAVVRAFTIP